MRFRVSEAFYGVLIQVAIGASVASQIGHELLRRRWAR